MPLSDFERKQLFLQAKIRILEEQAKAKPNQALIRQLQQFMYANASNPALEYGTQAYYQASMRNVLAYAGPPQEAVTAEKVVATDKKRGPNPLTERPKRLADAKELLLLHVEFMKPRKGSTYTPWDDFEDYVATKNPALASRYRLQSDLKSLHADAKRWLKDGWITLECDDSAKVSK